MRREVLHSEPALCADRWTDFSRTETLSWRRMMMNFTELSHWIKPQSSVPASPCACHRALWNCFLVHVLSIMITGKISSSWHSPFTWKIHSQIYWLNHSKKCCSHSWSPLPFSHIYVSKSVCKWKKVAYVVEALKYLLKYLLKSKIILRQGKCPDASLLTSIIPNNNPETAGCSVLR